jgi:enterochelin esterase family protein
MLFEYRRELTGGAVLTTLDVDSDLLRGNPLGDPSKRSQPVLLPPASAVAAGDYAGLPIVTILVGYTGFNHKVINKGSMWGDSVPERIAKGMASGAIPPAVCVWPAAETRLGGSQYVDSAGTGLYQSYVLDEVIPAVEAAFSCGGVGKRVVVGKSSGGFGALSLAMRRPAYFSAVGSHAGDMGFDMSHFRGFADALNCWAKYGGPEEFIRQLPELEHFGSMEHAGIEGIAMASCYSPNPQAPLGVDLPVDPATGEIRHDVFEGWLKFDPLRMVEKPEFAQGLRDLKFLYLDAGETDEFALQWGLKRLQVKLTELEISAHIEFCKGGHFTLDKRYAVSLPLLLGALLRK